MDGKGCNFIKFNEKNKISHWLNELGFSKKLAFRPHKTTMVWFSGKSGGKISNILITSGFHFGSRG